MDESLEEGEISDCNYCCEENDDDDDGGGVLKTTPSPNNKFTKTAIQAVYNNRSTAKGTTTGNAEEEIFGGSASRIKKAASDRSDGEQSETEEEEESNDEEIAAKKPRTRLHKKNIWSDVILEDQLTAQLSAVGHADKRNLLNRNVEAYEPSGESRVAVPDPDHNPSTTEELWNVTDDGESRNVKMRLGKQPPAWLNHGKDGFDNFQALCELPETISEADDERTIARYIARKLVEPKVELLHRVVRFTSKLKAIELCNRTVDVQASGGLFTANGRSKRSAGGVYIQLLKTDKDISKDTVDDIFAIEKANQKLIKKQRERDARKRKFGGKPANSQRVDIPMNMDNEKSSSVKNPVIEDNEKPALEQEEIIVDDFDLMVEPDIQLLE